MQSEIISPTAWLMILFTIFSREGKALINIKPSDKVVLLNGSTYFNCSTFNFSINVEVILWYHKVGSQRRSLVYLSGDISSNYRGRFRVEKDLSKGVVNLIVEAPTLGDAGTYQCVDERGVGEEAEAQLTVLETEPICHSNINPDGVIGSNDCGIPPDQVQMSCSIMYRGSSPVQLEWRNRLENDNSMLTSECSHTTNSTRCNLTATGDLIRNSSVYICQTKNSGKNTYSCSSDAIKILYVTSDNMRISKTEEDEYRCSANASQKCTYNWFSDDEIVSTSGSLKPTRSGQYICQANCALRGQTCLVTAGNLSISIAVVAETGEPDYKALIISLVIVALIIISALIGGFFFFSRRKKKQPGSQPGNPVSIPLLPVNGPQPMGLPGSQPVDPTSIGPLLVNGPQPIDMPVLVSETSTTILAAPTTSYEDNLREIQPNQNTPGEMQEAINVTDDGQTTSILCDVQLPETSIPLPTITDEDVADTSFHKFTVNDYFIDKGTSGAIYGPFRWNDKKCALKQILYSPDKLTEEVKGKIIHQTDFSMKLDHQHLVKVFGVGFPSPALYIVMEYAEGRSLDKILRPNAVLTPMPPFPLKIVQDWAIQIAEGMRYLHENNLVHRNLKAAHVLVMESPDVFPNILKVGSYTLTRDHDHSTVMSLKGTMAWMAPEYIRSEPFSMLSDVWSYGVTVWEILTREVPFRELKKETDLVKRALNKTLKLNIPDSCPGPLKDLLADCWNYEVNERPPFNDICVRLTKVVSKESSFFHPICEDLS